LGVLEQQNAQLWQEMRNLRALFDIGKYPQSRAKTDDDALAELRELRSELASMKAGYASLQAEMERLKYLVEAPKAPAPPAPPVHFVVNVRDPTAPTVLAPKLVKSNESQLTASLEPAETRPEQVSAAVELTLQPPNLVGASNDSATHYWFSSNMAVVFDASHFLVDARLADDCSDFFCNHTGHHVTTCKPSDPSHQVSWTEDGGRSFVPLWEVGGGSPWSPGLASRPFLGSATLALNDTARLALYQGKTWEPWVATAVLFTFDPVAGLKWELAEREVRYEGAEAVCSSENDSHLWNQGVIETAERWLLSAQCDVKVGVKKLSSVLIFSSNDGFDWELRSSVHAVAPTGAPHCESPGENTIVELTGGVLLLVARCGDGQQLLAWVSANSGRTWQRHELPRNMRGVMPVAVRFENGAIVLVTGRGGLALWLNAKGDGQDWALTNLAAKHNTLVLQNVQLNGSALQYTDAFVQFNATKETTAYSTLRKLGANDGVVCYDRLSSSDALPNKPSCSPPGNRNKNDHLFCSRFSVDVAAVKATELQKATSITGAASAASSNGGGGIRVAPPTTLAPWRQDAFFISFWVGPQVSHGP
jgi:hypothetical protein